MNEETKKDTPHPLVLIAAVCAAASVGIVFIALMTLHQISDGGMWAIAAMAAAPSLMGCGIAYFMCQQSRRDSSSANP
jgi:hypothetical protein